MLFVQSYFLLFFVCVDPKSCPPHLHQVMTGTQQYTAVLLCTVLSHLYSFVPLPTAAFYLLKLSMKIMRIQKLIVFFLGLNVYFWGCPLKSDHDLMLKSLILVLKIKKINDQCDGLARALSKIHQFIN